MSRAQLEEDLEKLHPASFAWSLACCRGNPAEAEEILQTTYLKVLEGRARFGGRSSFKTWLFAVIRRTAQSERRSGEWRKWLLVRWSRETRDPAAAGPQERLEEDQRKVRVRTALATLSPRQRQVLELVFYHDLSVREAGEVLGVSIGTARVHYDRGKKELLRRLEEESLDEQ
jgi:RNA polymerase sigma-70 factor (ECF subfamily)